MMSSLLSLCASGWARWIMERKLEVSTRTPTNKNSRNTYTHCRALEDLQRQGYIQSIGISNFELLVGVSFASARCCYYCIIAVGYATTDGMGEQITKLFSD